MTTAQYLALFRRLPDDAVLWIAGSDVEPQRPGECVVGRAVQYALALERQVDPDTVVRGNHGWGVTRASGFLTTDLAAKMYGGEEYQWSDVFYGVLTPLLAARIEEALARRVEEVVR